MPQDNFVKIEKRIRNELDNERFRHTMAVSYTAASLAMAYEADIEKARLAGLLHDCAKCIPNEKKLKLAERYGLPVSEAERQSPQLLHAKLGAYIARNEYGVEDGDVLGAIRWHTTGRPDMTLLEKIIFMADYIEPLRFQAKNLEEIRFVSFRDLDGAVYMTLRDTLEYLEERAKRSIDESTFNAYEYYKKLIENRNRADAPGEVL